MENINLETGTKISRKRRFSASAIDDHLNSTATTKIYITNEIELKKKIENEETYSLLNFSDEILLEIFQYLDQATLLNLGRTCLKLKYFIYEKKLWTNIDLSNQPMMGSELQWTIKYFTEETKSLKLQGMLSKYPNEKWKNITITRCFLEKLSKACPNLTNLEINEATLDIQNLFITDFPSSLKTLKIQHSESLSPRRKTKFFTKMESHFFQLEALYVEKCNWFETHDFIAFSKLPNLKCLSLKGCNSLRDCVPYCSLATRYGFKKLEKLDVRDTPISDSDIQCFNVTNSLRELLMDCPDNLRNQSSTSGDVEGSGSIQPPPPPPPHLNDGDAGFNNVVFVIVRDIRDINNEPEIVLHEEEVPPGRVQINVYRPNEPEQMFIDRNNIPRVIRPRNPFFDQFIQLESNNSLFRTPPLSLISDRGICSFGEAGERIPDIVNIRVEYRSPNTFLEKLIVRNYKLVTNVILRHLSTCSPKLKLLDVTGTSVTHEEIIKFKIIKPECKVISDFDK